MCWTTIKDSQLGLEAAKIRRSKVYLYCTHLSMGSGKGFPSKLARFGFSFCMLSAIQYCARNANVMR